MINTFVKKTLISRFYIQQNYSLVKHCFASYIKIIFFLKHNRVFFSKNQNIKQIQS